MSVIDWIGVIGDNAFAKRFANRVSRLGSLDDGLEHASDLGVGNALHHLVAQLSCNCSFAKLCVRQTLGVDLGVNRLDLSNQFGAGSDQRVNVDLGGFLSISEFSLELADFLVFGGDGGGEFSLGVGQGLCRFLLEPLNFGGVFNEYLDGLVAQNYRFSGHRTLL